MILKNLFRAFLLLISIASLASCTSEGNTKLTDRPEVEDFIQTMSTQYGFNQQQLTEMFANLKLRPEVIKRMQTPYEAKPWYVYQQFFIKPARINGGVQFWQAHRATLERATKIYGVPPEIIVAIIGVESGYGANKGGYPVLNTLATLAFDYPPRSPFFTKELQQFLLLCREQNWDPTKVLGSYAGAVGQPQFMPSSYRHYAVDFSHSGSIDLFDNIDDVIGSVASYLSANGWKEPGLIVLPAKIIGNKDLSTIPQTRKPGMTVESIEHNYGLYPIGHISKHTKALIIKVESAPNQYSYYLGFNNFYVITTYNTSKLYALAVTQLAEQIKLTYSQQQKQTAEKNKQPMASSVTLAKAKSA